MNDTFGRLNIGKKPGRDGSTVISLSEVSTIRALDPLDPDADGRMFCFMVSHAPISVVLRCRNDQDRQRWIAQLQQRVEVWRRKRLEEQSAIGVSGAAVAASPSRHRSRDESLTSYGQLVHSPDDGAPDESDSHAGDGDDMQSRSSIDELPFQSVDASASYAGPVGLHTQLKATWDATPVGSSKTASRPSDDESGDESDAGSTTYDEVQFIN